MLFFSLGFIFLSLVLMMYEDYRHRAISIKYLVAFILAALLLGFTENNLSDWVFNSGVNIGLLIFLLLTIQTYYKLRFKQQGWFIDKVMGKGDVFFFMALGFVFSPLNFLITLTFLSLLSIVISLPSIVRKGKQYRIPLITYMGFGLMIEFAMMKMCQIVPGSDLQLLLFLRNA